MIEMHNGKAYFGSSSRIELEQLVDALAEQFLYQSHTPDSDECREDAEWTALILTLDNLVTIAAERHRNHSFPIPAQPTRRNLAQEFEHLRDGAP